MKKLNLLLLACLPLFTLGCSKNIMPEVSAPDAKLNNGKFAEKFPINSDPEHIAIFHWTPIVWDIDLGKEKAIDAIKLYSDRPDHPMDAILVVGSLDNKNWFKITDLATKNHQINKENKRLIYADTKIKANVRYLKFALIARRLPETWFFDELEVYGKNSKFSQSKLTVTPVESAQAAINDALTAVGARQRLNKDFAKLSELAKNNAAVSAQLKNIAAKIAALPPAKAKGFSTVFPQNNVHKEIFAAYAALLRAEGKEKFAIQNPYRFVFPDTFAEVKNNFRSASFNMLPNERRSALFEIRSIAEKELTLDSRFEGNPDIIKALELNELPWTDTAEGIPVSTILLPQELNSKITFVPGLTKRLYLSVNAENLKPGNYKVTWKLGDKSYPVNIRISKVKLNEPRLLFGAWDYENSLPAFGLTPQNFPSAKALMKKMRVTMPWCAGVGKLWKRSDFDKDGNFIGKLDTENFDKWVKANPGKKTYAVHINVLGVLHVDGVRCDTKEFYVRTKNWIKAWDKHCQELGLKPGSVEWLLVDEVTNLEKAKYQLWWSRPFRDAKTVVLRNWEDPIVNVNDPQYAEMFDLLDSICPGRDTYYDKKQYEKLQEFRKKGKKLYSYSCNGPSRLFDPFSYYKMNGLGAWHDKTVGFGLWSMGDHGAAEAFNEYLLTWAIFTFNCVDKDKLYSTLALEAIREGIEDHELVKMVEEKMPSMTPANRAKAQKLLDELFTYIEKNTHIHIKWFDDKVKIDRQKADWFREEFIKLLEHN